MKFFGVGRKSIVMQILIVMVIFLSFSDQIFLGGEKGSGGQTASEGRPLPVEERQYPRSDKDKTGK